MIVDNRVQPETIDWGAIETDAAWLLSRYIQFDTSNPPGYEAPAIEFLADILSDRGFTPQILESAPGRANLITRLSGQKQATTAPCLLYAHADVVPADPLGWSVPPFSGDLQQGFVWGRGALDDKGLGIIFLEALTLLKQCLPPLQRDIILLIAADEEATGRYGTAWLLDHHPHLLKAGYVWDEGGIAVQQAVRPGHYMYSIAVAEKTPLTVNLTAHGTPGHAALPQLDNPQDRLVTALLRIRRWQRPPRLTPPVIAMLKALAPHRNFPHSYLFARADWPAVWPFLYRLLAADPFFEPLIRNTINLTMLHGGQSSNVIPAQAQAKLDIRLLPGEEPAAVLADLRSIIADPNIVVEADELPPPHAPTPIETDFYRTLVETLQDMGPAGIITPYMTPGATDSRFFRRAGMKAYGFVPMLLDSQELNRIHGVDERVSTANLRWGTQVVFEMLRRLG